MGMFTTIIHEGKEYQFKHGWDDCDTYQVGDKIEWTPDPRYPGIHIDGVYDSIVCDHDYSQGPWVIIKDCVIVAVEPFVGPDYQYLVQKYGITKPDHKLWSKEAWKAKHKREKEVEEGTRRRSSQLLDLLHGSCLPVLRPGGDGKDGLHRR